LENLEKYFDDFLKNFSNENNYLIFVDDGSTDKSSDFLYSKLKSDFTVLKNHKNMGLGSALKTGFDYAVSMPDFFDYNYVITIDSDFQHNFSKIDLYISKMKEKKFDCFLIRRNLKSYPLVKKLGNYFFSGWTSVLLKKKFYDVETGFRIFTPETLELLNRYYKGYKYSCAQEIAVILVKKGFKISNSEKCELNHIRSNTSFKDVFINLYYSIATYLRV
jgi:glycosyltransferase involved in cell wall biosynthesis